MLDFFGTWGGHLCGFGGFLTAIAAVLYARARVAEFERSVLDLDWQQVSEISLDVAKLKKAAQKWQNNTNAQEKVSQKDLLERALMERMMQQPSNVQQMRRIES
jgi:galactose-1-phosphate uridylyltransferase